MLRGALTMGPRTSSVELRILFEETLKRFPAMEPAGKPTGVEPVFLNPLKTLPVWLRA
jgi:hypothetical protein